ncbi:MAG: NifB/NifX family molybdenum-iron cluster-binding protein [Spirochaetes bacterium]|nr:NifB/NifX family molybdenum-iron cluster-binding protein [Spirochaetota bacterium]
MRIAISSRGETLDAELDERFGRAAYFIIFDTEKGDSSSIANTQNLELAQGAGIQSARTVINAGAGALVTGNVGPKAFRTLNAAGIEIYLAGSGTVKEAIEAFQAGRLKKVDGANVEGHW